MLSFSCPQDLKKYGATTVVRVCEVTYDKTPLEKDGITVMVGGLQDPHPSGLHFRLKHPPACPGARFEAQLHAQVEAG